MRFAVQCISVPSVPVPARFSGQLIEFNAGVSIFKKCDLGRLVQRLRELIVHTGGDGRDFRKVADEPLRLGSDADRLRLPCLVLLYTKYQCCHILYTFFFLHARASAQRRARQATRAHECARHRPPTDTETNAARAYAQPTRTHARAHTDARAHDRRTRDTRARPLTANACRTHHRTARQHPRRTRHTKRAQTRQGIPRHRATRQP